MFFLEEYYNKFLDLPPFFHFQAAFSHKEIFNLEADFTSCHCEEDIDMASVPQGAFAAKKMRQREEQIQAALDPTQYNSKFMNSIWGQYNRYSVHNLKKLMHENTQKYFVVPVEKFSTGEQITFLNEVQNSQKIYN
uniref:Uncharacterized protein LOC114344800 n=1 Tax=Diabrotica virgifera virgifera TaxID=50390 RepID=A0A6P7GPA3_DIAVI